MEAATALKATLIDQLARFRGIFCHPERQPRDLSIFFQSERCLVFAGHDRQEKRLRRSMDYNY